MNEEDKSAPQEEDVNKEIDKLVYDGPLDYYVRLAGIEEGAHCAYFDIKHRKDGKLENTDEIEQGIKEADPENFEKISQVERIAISKPIEEITVADIEQLVDYNDEKTAPLVEGRRQAIAYCQEFVNGVLVPLKKIYKDRKSGVKFGLSIPPKDMEYYNYHYSPDEHTVYINRNHLELIAKYPTDTQVTDTSFNQEYMSQDHERRALIWKIDDARKNGHDEIADILKRQYDQLNIRKE